MRQPRRRHEAGIALVLALLSLMLLTFLGLTLATSTSTELQIANNYRWSQQAFYNAEAGLEVGKKVLATADWTAILPAPRATYWDGATAPTTAADGTTTPANRNFENWACDQRGNGAGYGRVLSDGSITYTDRTAAYGQNVNGAFTLWVRRPVVVSTDTSANSGLYTDSGSPDTLILTAEGIAPYSDAAGLGTVIGQQNRAVRTMETLVSRTLSSVVCGTLSGQVGGGPEGAGFGSCTPVDPTSIGRTLGMATPPIENAAAR
jgi:Tfp pilus assembly protein PilX